MREGTFRASEGESVVTTVAVVTPWYKAPELVPGYWDVIKAGLPDQVIIVENGVPGGRETGALDLSVYGGRWSEIRIPVPRNLGFSRACNLGLAEVTTDAVLFLNNDVVLGAGGWLEPLRRAFQPGFLVGANLRADEHTRVDGILVPYLDGWCVGGMTEDFRKLGGWSEEYEEPSYYGDNDLSVRAKGEGMLLQQVPVRLKHLGNYTSRQFDVSGVTERNRARYEAKVRELRGAGCL